MNGPTPNHQFAEAKVAHLSGLNPQDCELIVRQEPRHARVAVGKEKDRKPVDPPPIIQLKVSNYIDPSQSFLQSPYVFMSCSLVGQHDRDLPSGSLGTSLAGTLVSSLHRLKDTDNSDGAFFVFADLSVKIEGVYRLKFTLYEVRGDFCQQVKETMSMPFQVHSTKNFPGMSESTFLTRSFSDQGVRLRLRKEPRALLRKRGPAHDDYEPRHYQRNNRGTNQDAERQTETSSDSQDQMRQNEQGDSLELQSHSHPNYDQRPQTSRHYSLQSVASYPGTIPYNDSSKRPRTGSEQSQASSFSQATQPLETSQYTTRLYTDTQAPFNGYPQQPQQTVPYGFSYTQSPSSAHSARDQYFSQRLSTTEPTPPYDVNAQRSPTAAYYPHQPQSIRYPLSPAQQQGQYGPILAPSPPQRLENTQSAFEGLGIGRGQDSPAIGGGELSGAMPMIYGRMNTAPTYATLPTSMPDRRESYNAYSVQGQNYIAGIGAGFVSQGPGIPTSGTTSGPLHGGY